MFRAIWGFSTVSMFLFGAFSSSSSYQLQSYGLGSGGTNTAASPSYKLNGSSGEVGGTTAAGTSTKGAGGSTETRQANVPLAPTLSNSSGSYYNKLQVTINTSGSDASDYTYSIAVSTDSFTTANYVQADGTLAASAVYQTYATWGGAGGATIVGLSPGTTYQAKVNANQVGFSASAYGPATSTTTGKPSLTFSVSPASTSFPTLTPGSVMASSSDLTFSFATNGAAGGTVYAAGLNSGLKSTAVNNTITSASGDLSGATEGFGLRGGSATQTSGGPLSAVVPYAGSGSVVGLVSPTFRQLFTSSNPIVGGTASGFLRAKAGTLTPAAQDYSETLTFVASANF